MPAETRKATEATKRRRSDLRPERIQHEGPGAGEAGSAAWPADLDFWWTLILGLRSGAPVERFTAELRAEELPAALVRAPGWALLDEADGVWLCTKFQFPHFEAAAVFVHFLFASVEVTTYPFAHALSFDERAEVKVRLSGPTHKALNLGVVLLASVLRNVFDLTRGQPGSDRGAAGAGIAPTDRPLTGVELETVLTGLPGWTLVADGSAILRDFEFRDRAGTERFLAGFGAVARLNDFDLDFVLDVAGKRAAVALGARSFEGITRHAALLVDLEWASRQGERIAEGG